MHQRGQPGELRIAEEFATAFAALLDAARLNPDKLLRELRRQDQQLPVERATLYDWKNGQHLPGDEAVFLIVIRICLQCSHQYGTLPPLRDEAEWLALLRNAKQSRDSGRTSAPSGSHRRPAVHVRTAREWGPVALGVHKAIGGNPLPAFVRRRQDDLLDAALNPAVAANRLIVLRGGSSTGKSRSVYQAVSKGLLERWRLEYPLVATELLRLLDEGVPSRTVLWLREFRDYADAEGGQEALARLARLLTDSNNIIVVTTMWERSWNAYTSDHRGGPGTRDQYLAARALLAGLPEPTTPADIDPRRGGVIDVPDEFSDRDLAQAQQLHDPAMTEAVGAAASDGKPGRVIQYLAGVPDLLRHYEGPGADPYVRAVITTAIDVARMINTRQCTPAFLHRAAVGYLADEQRSGASDTWCETAIADATTELRGAVRALTPIPPQHGTGVESYRLADYLEQHGRKIRAETIPPPSFWVAAGYSKLQANFAEAASSYGLLQLGAQLAKNATSTDASAAAELVRIMHHLNPDDERPSAWAAANVDLTRTGKVQKLLKALRDVGAYTQVTALLQRDLAANADMSDTDGIAFLLEGLREAEADAQVTALLARNPAFNADATDSFGIYFLLLALHKVGADAQVAVLAKRAVASTDPTDAYSCASLLGALREAGANEHMTALLAREPALHADLAEASVITDLLMSLHEVGADAQVSVLAERAVASADPSDLHALTTLLSALHDVGAEAQATALLAYNPAAHVDLSDTFTVGLLLEVLHKVAANAQMSTLLGRDIGIQADLTDPSEVAYLLTQLQKAGADDQIAALLARDPVAAADPSDPLALTELLDALGKPGAEAQMATVLDRLPGAGAFEIFLKHSGRSEDFRFGRGHDGRPAAPWGWDDLE